MSWYKDKISDGTAKLALQGAGAGAKALANLARIPLAGDKRKARDRKLTIAEEANRNKIIVAEMKAGATLEQANIKANAIYDKNDAYRGRTAGQIQNKNTDVKISAARNTSRETVANTNKAKSKYRDDTNGLIQVSKSKDKSLSDLRAIEKQKLKNKGAKAVATTYSKAKKIAKPVTPKMVLTTDSDGRTKRVVTKAYDPNKNRDFSIAQEKKKQKIRNRARGK